VVFVAIWNDLLRIAGIVFLSFKSFFHSGFFTWANFFQILFTISSITEENFKNRRALSRMNNSITNWGEQSFPGMTEHLFPAIILTDSAKNVYRQQCPEPGPHKIKR